MQQLISSVWQVGLPIVAVASSALVLVAAVRSREQAAPVSRAFAAFAVLVGLRLAGEAALGDQRPVFERQWKGTTALLLAVAAAVHLWRRYRRRDPGASEAVSVAEDEPTRYAAHRVTMPALGKDVVEATVTRWLKQIGDRVEVGEPLVEVSTDKVDTEVRADTSGRLREIRIPAGVTAPVGSAIALIEPPTS